MEATDTPTRQPIILPGAEEMYDRFHFAPAFRVGSTIYVSGVIGQGPDGHAPESVEEEFAAVFAQLGATLEAAGSSLGDIVELTSFHVDMKNVREFMKAKDQAIDKPYPAWTAIGCTGLVDPGARVEVKVTAVLSSDAG